MHPFARLAGPAPRRAKIGSYRFASPNLETTAFSHKRHKRHLNNLDTAKGWSFVLSVPFTAEQSGHLRLCSSIAEDSRAFIGIKAMPGLLVSTSDREIVFV